MPLEKKSNKKASALNNKKDLVSSPNTKDENQNTGQLGKWFFFILLVAGIALLSESLYERSTPPVVQMEMQSQSHFVSRDLYDLYKKGQIPKFFFNLRSIKWSYYDDELRKQIPEEVLPFKATSNGAYNLEVDAFSSQKTNSKIAILQMNLIEIKSGNKIWELSRNYEIQNSK